MNTTDIKKYLDQLPRSKIQTVRVCASDLLPSSEIHPSSAYVVNTMPHTDSGEHWVIFYLPPEGDVIEYFDSFGRAPYPSVYQQFLRRNKRRRYLFNKYRLQGFASSVCGKYVLCYLYCRLQLHMELNDFVNIFDLSSASAAAADSNDALITRMFARFYS